MARASSSAVCLVGLTPIPAVLPILISPCGRLALTKHRSSQVARYSHYFLLLLTAEPQRALRSMRARSAPARAPSTSVRLCWRREPSLYRRREKSQRGYTYQPGRPVAKACFGGAGSSSHRSRRRVLGFLLLRNPDDLVVAA